MSDQWTPTDRQVRDGYRYDAEDDYRDPVNAGANAERAGRAFDRWLAAHDRAVARAALDGYAAMEEESFLALHVKGAPVSAAQCSHAALTAHNYRDTEYEEPTS